MKKLSKDKLLYVFVALVLLFDILATLIMSILTPNFKWEKITTLGFWMNVLISQALTLTAYFAAISIGKNRADKGQDVVALTTDLKDKFKRVDDLYLAPDLDEHITIENLKYRCDAFIEKVNRILSKTSKKKVELRKELIQEKNDCIAWRNYYKDLNLGLTPEKPSNDFDVSIERCHPNWINIRTFKTVSKDVISKEVGSFKPTEIVAQDSVNKVLVSLILTILFTVIGLGSLKGGWEGAFEAIWRIFLICLNIYLGYEEGVKLINVYKVAAFDEKKSILNDFFNKMYKLGKIKLKAICEQSNNQNVGS